MLTDERPRILYSRFKIDLEAERRAHQREFERLTERTRDRTRGKRKWVHGLPPKRGIYFVQAEDMDVVKIGRSNSIEKRLIALQIGSPVRLQLIAVIGREGVGLEKWLHSRYQRQHMYGEWFRMSQELRDLTDGKDPEVLEQYRIWQLSMEPVPTLYPCPTIPWHIDEANRALGIAPQRMDWEPDESA